MNNELTHRIPVILDGDPGHDDAIAWVLAAASDQLDVLAGASLFITHCGMNSASEGLYMGVPELLFPLTGEQQAVARRVQEMGAGRLLTPKEADDPAAIRRAIREALADGQLREAAAAMRADFLACGGPKEAADFIEQVGRKT